MNSGRLENWLQITGLFGVIGSLMFVGLQMRQDREIALAEMWQARTAAVVEYSTSMAGNEMVMSALAEIEDPVFGMDTVEDQSVLFAIWGAMYLWENSHYQYQHGFLPEEHWTRILVGLRTNLSNSFWRPNMLRLMPQMTPSFRAVLEDLAEEVELELVLETRVSASAITGRCNACEWGQKVLLNRLFLVSVGLHDTTSENIGTRGQQERKTSHTSLCKVKSI